MRAASLLLFLLAACHRAPAPHPPAATVLLRGGTVWTGDAARPRAQAIALEGATVLAVGSDTEVERALAGRTVRTIELRGRVVTPGFIDAHVHILSGGLLQAQLDLSKATTLEAVLAAVKADAASHPEREWLQGRGWTFDLFAGGKPTRQLLDAAVADRPVVLTSYDGHALWANSKALALAGVGPQTPSPRDGEVVRELDTRTPSGLLLERAVPLVTARIPTSITEKHGAVVHALQLAAQQGLTTLCEAGRPVADVDEVYLPMVRAGQLPLRVVYGARLDEGVEAAAALRQRLSAAGVNGRLRLGPLKGFVDGVIEANTAALLAPPADGSGDAAPVRLDARAIAHQITTAGARGFDTQWHAIGDAAGREVLDAVALARVAGLSPDRRVRIEHLELIDPRDLPRFKQLGVIASVMPTHAEPGPVPGQGVWARKVGPARLPNTFAFRDLLDAGALLAFGSDWPVVGLSVLHGLGVATTRQRPDGIPVGGFQPRQRITPDEALRAATSGAAFACGVEAETGVLRPGFAADLVVLSAAVQLEDGVAFFGGEIDLTIADGQVIFERSLASPRSRDRSEVRSGP